MAKKRAKLNYQVYAIVPAAGLSERMGDDQKLGLKLGSKTILERVGSVLADSTVTDSVIVLGPATREQWNSVKDKCQVVALLRNTPDMSATVRSGLEYVAGRFEPGLADAFLLAVGDQPTIKAEVVDQLVNQHQEDPTKIRVPVCNGKRGHPVLFPWFVVDEVSSLPADQGINSLLDSNPERVAEVPVESDDILVDVDEPGDYNTLSAREWD